MAAPADNRNGMIALPFALLFVLLFDGSTPNGDETDDDDELSIELYMF